MGQISPIISGSVGKLVNSWRGAPKIMHILISMLSDRGRYPLDRLLAEDHEDCDTACYRCLLRYGNQPYHGLLDWRLGLSYIRATLDPQFVCGLDGEFAHLGLERWQATAGRLAEEMAQRFGGETRTFSDGMIRAFRLDSRGGTVPRWVLIAHPLWDWDGSQRPSLGTILAKAEEEASLDGPVDCWDTFNLMRRPVQVREWIREGRR
jgi:DEAD/DEAH box helicase domain-containing protein